MQNPARSAQREHGQSPERNGGAGEEQLGMSPAIIRRNDARFTRVREGGARIRIDQ